MNDSACLELLTQNKDRYKFSSHTFILGDIPDSRHNDWENYDNSHWDHIVRVYPRETHTKFNPENIKELGKRRRRGHDDINMKFKDRWLEDMDRIQLVQHPV